MRIAAMDLGTNTFRLLIAENINGNFRELYRETNITRLGEGLQNTNLICDSAALRAVNVLKQYKKLADKYEVQKIFAVGTSAFRSALNGEKLIKYISDETGVEIDIITGKKEAELTVKGILSTMKNPIGEFYHLDIGGGSTEISYVKSLEIVFSRSFKLGVVSLAETYDNIKDMEDFASGIISQSVNYDINKDINIPLVATSGTPVVVACVIRSLNQFKPSEVNGMNIGMNDVNIIKNRLIKDNEINKLDKYGSLLMGREDLIVPGMVILTETMKYLGNDSMIISDKGLLEGLSYL